MDSRTKTSPAPVNDGSSEPKLTTDDVLNFIGFGPLQIIAFCLVGLASLSFGVEIVVFSFIDIPVQKLWNLTGVEYGILPSVTGISNIIGGFLYGYLSDQYGRIWPFALSLVNVGVFGLASAFSPSFVVLVVMRALTSLGVIGGTLMFPALIEFLPVRNRGKVLVMVIVIQAIGNCIAGGLAWWLIPTYSENGWRYLIIATSIPSLLAAIFRMIFHVQSPRFLMTKGKIKEARKVFSLMAQINGKNLNDFLPEEKEFQEVVSIELKPKQSFMESTLKILSMFKRGYLRKTICLSIIYVIETVGYYGSSLFLPKVLSDLGVNAYFTAFVGFLGQIPGIFLMAIIVEWEYVGRLNSLRFFTILTIASFLLFAFVQNQITIPVFIILIYFSSYPILPLLYTYMSESYPTGIRSIALGYYNNLSSFFGIFVPYLSGYVSGITIPWLYPTVWAGLFVVQLVTALFLNHETLGVSLTDTV